MARISWGAILALCFAFVWSLSPALAAPGPVCYVDEFASGAADGSSWGDAYTGVDAALADLNCTEIWVADGSYAAGATMSLRNGVALYGGFAGGETDRDERDWENNQSKLSGENSYRVLTSTGNNDTAVLDGFTIGDGSVSDGGAGLVVSGGSPTLRNLTFLTNIAVRGGALLVENGADALFLNISFVGNESTGSTAVDGGGGLYIADSTVVLDGVVFTDNVAAAAARGNALMVVNSTVQVFNSTFENNDTSSTTTIFCSTSFPSFTNSTFTNTNYQLLLCGPTTYQNVTAVRTELFGEELENSIVWNADVQITRIRDSVIFGGCQPSAAVCINVLTGDPLLGSLQDNGGPTKTMALGSGSPARDAGGINAACAAVDQRGVPRPQGSGCDMGAYEFIVQASGPLCYVDADMTWAGNGSSWANAYRDLQHALFNSACTEIWVAEGTYTPDGAGPGDRFYSFVLQNGVEIYGGFAGTETLLSERDWQANATILSGEIGGPDHLDNSIHVVIGSGRNNSAVLDGFTVRGGSNATGGSEPNYSGAGIYNDAGSPTLRNLFITDNRAAFGGGIANLSNSNPQITNVTFYANYASYGAGMSNRSGSAPSISSATFHANQAVAAGAGVYNDTSAAPSFANVTFYDNDSSSVGGGMYNNTASPTLNNVTFYNNTASTGHSMENLFSNLLISNSIFWNTHSSGDELTHTASFPIIDDSLVKGGCPTGATCSHVINADPLLGALQDNGGFTETLALDASSPAIEAGNDSTCATNDQRGVTRPQHTSCDMGAYEYDGALPTASSGSGASGTSGAGVASKPIVPNEATLLEFGRISVSVPALAIPPGQTGCVLTIQELGSSAEFGFTLDDTVWDLKIHCGGNELNIFFDVLTVCIRPVDGTLAGKNVYHRHGTGSFQPLSGGQLPAYVCGQTRVLSLFTLGQLSLPATGFAPGGVALAQQPELAQYADSGLSLSIPRLGVELDVLGVPQGPNGWDVSWLSASQAGYLYGTTFPTWAGNSVLTAHVWNADNTPGPFHGLRTLQYGDRFTVSAYGYTYTYEVRSTRLVHQDNLSVLGDSAYSQITLITCESYSESSGEYVYRRAVQAVLIEVAGR